MDVRMKRRLGDRRGAGRHLRLCLAAWVGLVLAPPDREMGDVQRIMYAHVPMVQMMLLAGTITFVCSVLYLFRASWKTDALAEASAELALVFGAIGTTLGAIWGRPTWGVYWAWDPRLTTVAILLVALAGYLALRRFVDDPERRAVWGGSPGRHRGGRADHLLQRQVVEEPPPGPVQSGTVDAADGARAPLEHRRLLPRVHRLPGGPLSHRARGPRAGSHGARGRSPRPRGGGIVNALATVLAAVGEGRIQGAGST